MHVMHTNQVVPRPDRAVSSLHGI